MMYTDYNNYYFCNVPTHKTSNTDKNDVHLMHSKLTIIIEGGQVNKSLELTLHQVH